MSKVSIIGAGEVGASCATCLAERDFVNDTNYLGRSGWFAAGAAVCEMVEAVVCD